MWIGAVLAVAGAGLALVAGAHRRRELTREGAVTDDVRTWRTALSELLPGAA
jgi:hypothetical protein